ncbi:MAG TPA: asparagine synthase-related protein [Gemmatimonadaceae bacterium]|nr:asparagine synthase-related protein [Gemmatimonadaceae bacterium]
MLLAVSVGTNLIPRPKGAKAEPVTMDIAARARGVCGELPGGKPTRLVLDDLRDALLAARRHRVVIVVGLPFPGSRPDIPIARENSMIRRLLASLATLLVAGVPSASVGAVHSRARSVAARVASIARSPDDLRHSLDDPSVGRTMSSHDLREVLAQTLGTAYSLERELGGGGLSRVFVAEERALGRHVVVKVLPPEVAQDASLERFRREIRVLAALQRGADVPAHALTSSPPSVSLRHGRHEEILRIPPEPHTRFSRSAMPYPIAEVIDLIPPGSQSLWSTTEADARSRLRGADPRAILELEGSFALVAREGERVLLARSLDRPLRYFLAKAADGPVLIVAERIDEIAAELARRGWADQFHPSYTRMVPAHHVTTLRLIGCPDPNPVHQRFFDPPRGTLPADLDLIGRRYIEAIYDELRRWLATQEPAAPIGVPFSGGIDSGAILLCLCSLLLNEGRSPARLKAFTLSVDGDGADARQAREFLARTELEMLGEAIDVPSSALDPLRAVAVIEDYKPLDVECAAVNLALLAALRERHPDWRLLVDGDGGDENLKDYPIEENSELTIRSVVGNRMLYQEGWGVDSVKHSLTYSGGYGRGCVRSYACAREHGFIGFSPYTRPSVIAVAEAMPFDELTGGSHERLYSLKGEIVSRGVRSVLGLEMPVFQKRRFQEGAVADGEAARLFPRNEARYRRHFEALHAAAV